MKEPMHDHDGMHGKPRGGGGRLAACCLVMVFINIALGFFWLFALGKAMEFDWTLLKAGTSKAIVDAALMLLLLLLPLILTILVNRLTFRAFRGRRRFPRGAGLLALLIVVIVQAVTLYLVYRYGLTGNAGSFAIDFVQPMIS